jgi:hypothetical protein
VDSDRNYDAVQSSKSNAMSTNSNFDKLQDIIDNFVRNPAVAHRATKLIQVLRKQILAVDSSIVAEVASSKEITSHIIDPMISEGSSAVSSTSPMKENIRIPGQDVRGDRFKSNPVKNDIAKNATDVNDEILEGKQCIRRSNRRASISASNVQNIAQSRNPVAHKKLKKSLDTSRPSGDIATEDKVIQNQLLSRAQFGDVKDSLHGVDKLSDLQRHLCSPTRALLCVFDPDAEDDMRDGMTRMNEGTEIQSQQVAEETSSADKENRIPRIDPNVRAAAHCNLQPEATPLKNVPVTIQHPISDIDLIHARCQTPPIKNMHAEVTEGEISPIALPTSAAKLIFSDDGESCHSKNKTESKVDICIRNLVPFKFPNCDSYSDGPSSEANSIVSSPIATLVPCFSDAAGAAEEFRHISLPGGRRSSQSCRTAILRELTGSTVEDKSQHNGGVLSETCVPALQEDIISIVPSTSLSWDLLAEPHDSAIINPIEQLQSSIPDDLPTAVQSSHTSQHISPKLVRRSATFESYISLEIPLPLTQYSVESVETLQLDLLSSVELLEKPVSEPCRDSSSSDQPQVLLESAVGKSRVLSPSISQESERLPSLSDAFITGEDCGNVNHPDELQVPSGCDIEQCLAEQSNHAFDMNRGNFFDLEGSHPEVTAAQLTDPKGLDDVDGCHCNLEEKTSHDISCEIIIESNTEGVCMPLPIDQSVRSITAVGLTEPLIQSAPGDTILPPSVSVEDPTHFREKVHDTDSNDRAVTGTTLPFAQNQTAELSLSRSDMRSTDEHHLLHGIFSSKAMFSWSFKMVSVTFNVKSMKASSSHPGLGFIVALVSLMYNCPVWHPPDVTAEHSASRSRTPTPAVRATTTALTALIPHMTVSKDEKADRSHKVLSPKRHRKNERKVHFCDIDGSSVSTPSPSTSYKPIFSASKRLHSLIKGIDHLTAVLLRIEQSDGSTGRATEDSYFDSILSSCELLTEATTAAYMSRALLDHLSIYCKPREILAIAHLISSELHSVRKLNDEKVSHDALRWIPSILRQRAAWMTTSSVRSQLRWLLDPPPQALTAGSGNLYAVSSSPRCSLFKVVTVEDSSQTPSNRRKSIKLDSVLTVKMTLSSLVTQALRQIYDAFIAAADNFLSVGHGTVDNVVTEFLMAAVSEDPGPRESSDVMISLTLFDGLSETQPQVLQFLHIPSITPSLASFLASYCMSILFNKSRSIRILIIFQLISHSIITACFGCSSSEGVPYKSLLFTASTGTIRCSIFRMEGRAAKCTFNQCRRHE